MSFQSTNVWARGWSWTWDVLFVLVLFCGLMVLLSCIKWAIKSFKKNEETPFAKTKLTKAFFIVSIVLILIMTVGEMVWRMDAYYGISTFYVSYWWHYLVFTIFTYAIILAIWIVKGIYTKQFPLYKQELIDFKTSTVKNSLAFANGVKTLPSKVGGKVNEQKQKMQERSFKKDKHPNEPDLLNSPVDGKVVKLSTVDDQAFSQGLLGDGIAIVPEKQISLFTAPISGKVTTIFPTNHAYGIETSKGTSVLVHIGIDTVKLDGEHFKAFVKQGDFVKAGDKIIEADLEAISKKGYDITTMIVCTPETKGELSIEVKTKSIQSGKLIGTIKNIKE